ncbi:hypothetical protein HK405_010101 [Cladochytrium tenue]|nr:hypothetical protein HK405_010101 [Cladochytrium tenue]
MLHRLLLATAVAVAACASHAAAVITQYTLASQSHCSTTTSQIQWDITPVPAAEDGLPYFTVTFTPATAGQTIPTPTSVQPELAGVNGNTFFINAIDDGPKLGFVLSGIGCDATTGTFTGWTMSLTGTTLNADTGANETVTFVADAFLGTGTAAATTTSAAAATTAAATNTGVVVITSTITSTIVVTATAAVTTAAAFARNQLLKM